MDFALTPAQEALCLEARAFAAERLAPSAAERERLHSIPASLVTELAQAGLLGINVPRELGGLEAGPLAYVAALREIAAGDASVAVTMAVTNMVAEVIARFGTAEQRQRYVPSLVSGAYFAGSFALSEPGAGSDAASLTTRAEPQEGGGWCLNGQKMWITSGDGAGVIIVWARTGDPGPKGLSCFLVDQGTDGVSFGKPEEKMGLRASHTVAVGLQDVRLPAEQLLGPLNGGFALAMAALDGGRIGIGAQAVGLGLAAQRIAVDHMGSARLDNQAQQFWLADMAAQLDGAWLLTLRAARLKEQGRPFSREAAMAKLYASESANRAIRHAADILGEYGYMEAAGVARLFRDCRVTQVYEGTSEIQRLVISRDVLKNAM